MASKALGARVKTDVLRSLDEGFARLRRDLDPNALAPSSSGAWGRFEVLSHIIGWHLLSARRLGQIARGDQPEAPGPEDDLNERFVSERASLAPAVLLAQLEASFDAMKRAVANVPEGEFWLGTEGDGDSLAHFIAMANGPLHYEEHRPDLEAG